MSPCLLSAHLPSLHPEILQELTKLSFRSTQYPALTLIRIKPVAPGCVAVGVRSFQDSRSIIISLSL